MRTCTALLKTVMPRLFLTCRDMIKVAHTEAGAAGSLDHGLLPQFYRAARARAALTRFFAGAFFWSRAALVSR
jgi:hypothetical protein